MKHCELQEMILDAEIFRLTSSLVLDLLESRDGSALYLHLSALLGRILAKKPAGCIQLHFWIAHGLNCITA